MNFTAAFLDELKERSGQRCECERRTCHEAHGRCSAGLLEEPGGLAQWRPVFTGDHHKATPVAIDYMALCGPCAVPRNHRA